MAKGIRRVVTTHHKSGNAVVGIDNVLPVSGGEPELGVETYTLWVTDAMPADNSGSADAGARKVGIPPPDNGTLFRIVDFHPMTKEMEAKVDADFMTKTVGQGGGSGKPLRHPGMHKTRSVDYIVVMSGEIDMLLDEGEVHLKAGDVMVQRGTIHAWVNHGKETCRCAVVLVDAKEV